MLRPKVWLRQLWNFNKSLLVLSKVDADGAVDEGSFSEYPLWIQLQGLSTLWMAKNVGALLSSKAGKVLSVDGDGSK